MNGLYTYKIDKYIIVSLEELSEETLVPFSKTVLNSEKKIKKSFNPLGGRAEIVIKNLPQLGMTVFKNYFRGGIWGIFNKRLYLKSKGKIRPLNEILFLEEIRKLNIPVPQPVAAYYSGNLIYKGGTVTKYISSPYTLAQFCLNNEKKGEIIFKEKFLPVFEKLIEHKIYHCDLHPGNVVVSNDEDIYIIDFDKATFFEELPFYLREKLESRWNRAVRKHKLPSFLAMVPKKRP
ncbi:MAG: phosphotransferase [Desulfobacteraceae bacterium]|nr:phosphotransferase [Desulfobacteraceae bacterium]